ncbi:MAG: N-acetylmuramoyl-L-alanine amidase [Eubacterium sp.]|nr:N-acetylmuramoyl-L-alanine amidase [Eubacterium sp.]
MNKLCIRKGLSLLLSFIMIFGIVYNTSFTVRAEDTILIEDTIVDEDTLVDEGTVADEDAVEDENAEIDEETVVASKEGEKVVIVLDPGHGGTDTGAAYTWNGASYVERDINQAIANACKTELEKDSRVKVYMTRTSTSEALHGSIGNDLDWRCDYAHSVAADIFISIHCNSSATANSKSGAEVYVPNSSYCKTAADVGKTVGISIGKQLNALGISNGATYTRSSQNGSKYDDGSIADYYAVIRGCKEYCIPSMIVEHAYVNNSSDCSNFFGTWDKIAKLGVADAKGIIENIELLEKNRVDPTIAPTADSQGWVQKGNFWVYYNEKKELQKGFFEVDGQKYYAKSTGEVATGWQKIEDNWYFFNERGAMQTSIWKQSGSSWYWFKADGKAAKGPTEVQGLWYLFDNDSVMKTGWQKYNNKWYYMNSSGAMYRNAWYCGSGSWYYLTEDGTMATGYKVISDVAYCFDSNGVMASGWMYTDNKWYYALSSGALVVNSWAKVGGIWYYFGDSGKMETGLINAGGGLYYYLNSSGALQYGWIYDGTYWYYGLDSGAVLRATWFKSGSDWYYFNDKCKMLTGVHDINGTIYCFNSSGQMESSGWISSGNNWYYADSSGTCAKSEWKELSGTKYYFDENGKMVTGSFIDGDTEYIFNADGAFVKSQAAPKKETTTQNKTEDTGAETDEKTSVEETEVADASIYEGVNLSDTSTLYAIMGASSKTADQMAALYKAKGYTYPAEALAAGGAGDIETFAKIIVEEANAEGVKAEVVFAQIMHETGWLQYGGDVKIEQFNFCGMGAIGGGEPGYSFTDVREGIRVDVQHLKAYASTEALKNTCVDPRFKYVERGVSPYVEYLGQKENPSGKGWATNVGYGIYIVKIIQAM